jgi:hypothetical protein
MNRRYFLTKLKERNYTSEEAAKAEKKWLAEGGTFDDDGDIEPIKPPRQGATREWEPNYRGRVLEGFEKAREENIKRQKNAKHPKLRQPIEYARTVTEAPYIALSEIPGAKQVGGAIGKVAGRAISGAEQMATRGARKESEYTTRLSEMVKGTPRLEAREKALKRAEETPSVGESVQRLSSMVPQEVKSLGVIGMNVAGLVTAPGAAKDGAKAFSKAATATGKAVGEKSKSLLLSGMKPKDVTAKLAGKDVAKGAQKLVDDISTYKLESATGGFKGISEKANGKIGSYLDEVETVINKKVLSDPKASIDVDGTFVNFMDDLQSGKINAVFGEEAKSAELADDIYNALEIRGLTGSQTIDKIPEIKRIISNYGGGLFRKGPYNIAKDPLKQQVGELAYLRLTDDLEKIVPEIRQYNKAVHDIINVKKAADEAVKRIGNKDKIGLTDWMLLLGGPTAAQNLGVSSQAVAGIPGAVLIAKKALGSGRGASAGIKVGRALQGKQKVLPTTSATTATFGKGGNFLKKIKSQEGSIGGGYDFIGTPAIRDPKTGKIYTGNWQGHKSAIRKAENETVESRLKHEHFLDNTGRETPNVGFIDKKGNFISRKEAEDIVSYKNKSLTAMYHSGNTGVKMLLGTTAVGAGALAAPVIINKSKKGKLLHEMKKGK